MPGFRQTVAVIIAIAIFILGSTIAAADSGKTAKQLPAGLPFAFGGPFELTNHLGKRVTDKDFHGRFALLYFGYTYCPNICPVDLANMIDGLDALGKLGDKLTPVFVTVDPKRDTVKVLADYVSNFHPRMVGLTGSEADIKKVAKAFRIHRVKVLLKDRPKDDYLVSHSSLFVLLDPKGTVQTLIPHGASPERIQQVLQKYLSAKEHS